jgi:hypothetical protein
MTRTPGTLFAILGVSVSAGRARCVFRVGSTPAARVDSP